MPVNRPIGISVGQREPFVNVFPFPIVATRNPTATDRGEIGQVWINRATSGIFILGSVVANVSTWTATAGAAGTLAITPGPFTVTATVNAAQQIYLHANGGVLETVDIHSDQGTGTDSLHLHSDVGGIAVDGGLGTVNAITLNASNVAGGINVDAGTAGVDVDTTGSINLDSALAAATAIVLNTSDAAGGIDIDSGTAGVIVDTTGAISLDSVLASNFTATGAGIDLTLGSVGGRVIVDGSEAAANAVTIDASDAAGGIDVDSGTGGIDADSTGRIQVTSALAATDAVIIESTDAAGGIVLRSVNNDGQVDVVPLEVTTAGAAATLHCVQGVATQTGLVTGAGATEDITITNNIVLGTSGILVSAANLGANDAQMTVTRVTPAAGSFVVRLTNNGAAALNGNLILSFWVLS